MAYLETLGEIPKKMNAVVDCQPGDFHLEVVDVPEVDPEEVLLKNGGCGICVGEVKTYHGAPRLGGGDGQPSYIEPLVIPGHKCFGQRSSDRSW